MINNDEMLVLEADSLLGVAEVLERAKAKSVVTAHIRGRCSHEEAVELAEGILDDIHSALCPDHPKLRGYVFLTPEGDEDGYGWCDKLAISFDHLDAEEAASFMTILPPRFFHPDGDEFVLGHNWSALDAEQAAQALRSLHWDSLDDGSISLGGSVVMHPYVGTNIKSRYEGWLAVHLGARPSISGVRFHDPA